MIIENKISPLSLLESSIYDYETNTNQLLFIEEYDNGNLVNFSNIKSVCENTSSTLQETYDSIYEDYGDNFIIAIDESDVIANPEITQVFNNYIIREMNENDIVGKYTEYVVNKYVDTLDESYLDYIYEPELLLEATLNPKNKNIILRANERGMINDFIKQNLRKFFNTNIVNRSLDGKFSKPEIKKLVQDFVDKNGLKIDNPDEEGNDRLVSAITRAYNKRRVMSSKVINKIEGENGIYSYGYRKYAVANPKTGKVRIKPSLLNQILDANDEDLERYAKEAKNMNNKKITDKNMTYFDRDALLNKLPSSKNFKKIKVAKPGEKIKGYRLNVGTLADSITRKINNIEKSGEVTLAQKLREKYPNPRALSLNQLVRVDKEFKTKYKDYYEEKVNLDDKDMPSDPEGLGKELDHMSKYGVYSDEYYNRRANRLNQEEKERKAKEEAKRKKAEEEKKKKELEARGVNQGGASVSGSSSQEKPQDQNETNTENHTDARTGEKPNTGGASVSGSSSQGNPQDTQETSDSDTSSKSTKTINIDDIEKPGFLTKLKRYLLDKPRDFIAKMAVKLRHMYKKWMAKARIERDQGKASIFKRIALKLLQAVDWLMKKLSKIKSSGYGQKVSDKFYGYQGKVARLKQFGSK